MICTLLTALFPTLAFATSPGLFEKYGDGGRQFDEITIGHMLVYFHQRTLGEATVEKDYIVYQVDKDTGELLARKSHWRSDLPATPPGTRVSREQAEAMVEGEIQFSRLYIISPESDVFPLDSTPENPCWAVRSVGGHGEYVVTIVDAVSGVILGKGVPPPYTAFSLTGPCYFYPCEWSWSSWSQNAESWFNAMGYSTEEVEWPTEAKIQSHIQSTETAMFYELAHGGSTSFASGCIGGEAAEYTYASEIEAWMVGYEKMPFAFIGSCGGMCSTGNGTFAYEFRKGSPDDATAVGYCGMAEPQCDICWTYSIDWQNALFYSMSLGDAVKDAYEQADADYPVCASGNCMRFAGDEDFAVVPPVPRTPTMCGNGTCDPGENPCECPEDCNWPGSCCTDSDCSNANPCTNDWCDANYNCQHNPELTGTPCPDDGNECTDDQCDGAGTCVHPDTPDGIECGDPTDTDCTDPDTCDGAGTCVPNHAPDGTSCDDGEYCMVNDQCVGGMCEGTYQARLYADVYPLPHGDGAVEGFDILCILDAANDLNTYGCLTVTESGFVAGDIYPCDPRDNAVEGFDILAVLEAAGGMSWCADPCPPLP